MWLWHLWILDAFSKTWTYQGQKTDTEIVAMVHNNLPVKLGNPPGSVSSYAAYYLMPV
jgi:hypothetical protein